MSQKGAIAHDKYTCPDVCTYKMDLISKGQTRKVQDGHDKYKTDPTKLQDWTRKVQDEAKRYYHPFNILGFVAKPIGKL